MLLVEDDASLREAMAMVVEGAGFEVATVPDGGAALERFRSEPFDLLLVDVMLPVLDGLEVCREVRKSSTVPIIMVTARADTTDLVVGLELGADDYVTKPFDPPALVARMRAVLRRSAPGQQGSAIVLGDLEVDPDGFVATKQGAPLALSATELKLLIEMARHVGQVLSRESLLRRVWGFDYIGDSRMVDMAVKRLRSKVEDDPAHPRRIVTVRGLGYRLERA